MNKKSAVNVVVADQYKIDIRTAHLQGRGNPDWFESHINIGSFAGCNVGDVGRGEIGVGLMSSLWN